MILAHALGYWQIPAVVAIAFAMVWSFNLLFRAHRDDKPDLLIIGFVLMVIGVGSLVLVS